MSSCRTDKGLARARSTGALFGLGLLLAGCGFQLQGALNLPPEMAQTHLVADDTYTEFYRELQRELLHNSVELTDTPGDAGAILTIRGDETGQRVLSVSARNVPREFEIFYAISYDMQVDGTVVSSATDLTLTRDYTWDETRVLGKAEEQAFIRKELVERLVRQVLTRLSFSE